MRFVSLFALLVLFGCSSGIGTVGDVKQASVAPCIEGQACGGSANVSLCGIDEDCSSGFVCSRTQSVCVARCSSGSCSAGLECQSDGHCSAVYPRTDGGAPSCGGALLSTPRVAPNVHVVLDGSESMMDCIATGGDGIPLPGLCDSNPDGWLYTLNSSTSKWASAKAAVTQMTSLYGNSIRFGLSIFPSWTYGMPPNTKDANALYSWWVAEWNKKGGQLDCTGGVVKASAGENTATTIANSLTEWAPGAGTPIAAALNAAAQLPELADTSRTNYVLLVTDGMENCGGNPVGEVQNLRGRGVKTVVVGFGSAVDPSTLTQMAVAGGVESVHPLKYYQADDSATLVASLKTIAQGLQSCDFKLSKVNADVSKVFVYVNGVLTSRDTSHQKGWDVNVSNQLLTLYGATCSAYKNAASGQVSVVYGCPDDSLVPGGGTRPNDGNGADGGFDDGSGSGGGGGPQ